MAGSTGGPGHLNRSQSAGPSGVAPTQTLIAVDATWAVMLVDGDTLQPLSTGLDEARQYRTASVGISSARRIRAPGDGGAMMCG